MSDPATVAVSDDIEVESSGQTVEAPAIAPVLAPQTVAAAEEADVDLEARALEEEPPPAPKPRNSLQAKIDQAVGRQREAERRAEAAERQLAEARPAAQPPKPAEPQYTRPKPTEAEIGAKYQDYPAYIEDLTDWKLEQRDVQQQQAARQREMAARHEAHAQSFVEKIAKAEEADPEFWSKVSPHVATLRPSTALEPGERATALNAIADVVFASDQATEWMAYLSANPKEFQRLSTLPPNRLFWDMGKLEASFTRPAAASPGPAPKTPPVSQAPPPIKPVGTTASAAERDPLAEDLDIDEHIRVMNARDKKGRFVR